MTNVIAIGDECPGDRGGTALPGASGTGDSGVMEANTLHSTTTAPDPAALPPAFSARGLTVRYGSFTAVDTVDFSVRPGQIFALLGTNGAGKTTTVETLLGLHRPHGGQVRVLGVDPAADRRRLSREAAVIGQETGFAEDLTVAETVRLWCGLHRLRPPSGLLEKVGLDHRSGIRVGALSGGEKRRLDLALALVNRPKVLFADEPTTGLDPASRKQTWKILRGLADGGTAVLLTTHYLEEAERLADRIAIMNAGRLVASGTLAEITAGLQATVSGAVSPRPDWRPLQGELSGSLSLEGKEFRITTGALQDDLHRLLQWAARSGVELEGLEARQGSLDDLFTTIGTHAG
ncbi:ABC transporter ATP-binding protein [Salininema proteolyticum]|uniref:ABC transporter ATP-binding protein n=1 Tax=Salininema proteolyticum TaxID=1607685 RepID=A0ABV8TZT1_9ACTN